MRSFTIDKIAEFGPIEKFVSSQSCFILLAKSVINVYN